MPQKQQQRMFIHGTNLTSLYENIPQNYLHKELDGENGCPKELTEDLAKNFSKRQDYFLEDHIYRVEEKLRLNKIIDYDDVFGITGSFRKLNVD